MPLTIIGTIVMLGLAYIWLTRGFFSSFLHLVCTIIAGAIAFAAWEPLSYWILESSPPGGFMSFTSGVAWGVGLIVPFAVSLALLRLAVDKLLPANVVLTQKLDYAGGAVCGLCTGVITAGLICISLGFLRFEVDFPNQPVKFSPTGSVIRDSGMLIPVDKVTSRFYQSLSERAFRTSDPLARWHPDLSEEGGTMRMTFQGRGRNTFKTTDFSVLARFTVGDSGSADFDELLKDRWNPTTFQKVVDLDNHPYPKNTHIEGFIVDFKPSAREKDGKVAIGNGQVRLILENDSTDERMTVFPLAVSSQAEADKPTPARWRYDGQDIYIASVGGNSEAVFAFEFPCPPGFKPVALYLKGARHQVDSPSTATPKMKFVGASDRDSAISTGFNGASSAASGGDGAGPGGLDTSGAVKLARVPFAGSTGNAPLPPPEGMRITEMLPFVIQKGVHGNLELDEENNKNIILNGDAVLELTILQNKGLEKPIQIQRLLTTTDTVTVQIDVGPASKMSLVGRFGDPGAPTLFDSNGQAFVPIGFIYQDESKIKVSFKPGEPITSLSMVGETLTRSRPAQKLTFIYRCSRGVSLKYFGLGNKATVVFDPPVLLDQSQGH